MKFLVALITVLSAVYCNAIPIIGFGLRHKFEGFKEPPIQTLKTPFVSTKWITQQLDHFNPQETGTWQMRYMENDQYFQPGGPIFIYVGGEWTISAGWLQSGHMFDMAKELNGTMYYTEHRYYGQSHPTPNTTTENLRFLNIDQALADLAHFIVQKKSENTDLKDSGVIMVGGSYSATMVSWFRKKYPHLANGAWSSSAPLLAKADFVEYKEVVTESIKIVAGDNCALRIKSAFQEIERLVADNETKAIEEMFNLCYTLDVTNKLDVMSFFSDLGNAMSGVVQYHKNTDIQDACKVIENEEMEPLEAFIYYFNGGSSYCFNHLYQSTIKYYKNYDWSSSANSGNRQWMYQTCAEYGWYQTSGSENQVFGSGFPVELYTQMCHDIYDGVFDHEKVEENIATTNIRYGGMNPHFTNVYSTHGQLDPWRAMGIQEDLNSQSPTTIIPLVSHVADLYSISSRDSPEMLASKERITKLVKEWLNLS